MATIKKYNGSTWENAVVRKYGTASEIITLPTTIYADGTAITSYTIKGNTVQNGTPTPSNPVPVVGVGELETTGEHSGEYKIPISTAQGSAVNYLGSVQSERQVYKMILTGNEAWQLGSGATPYPYIAKADMPNVYMPNSQLYCTHFQNGNDGMTIGNSYALLTNYTGIATDIPSWKQWLADQYAAGTPVTIWYILETPTTGIVNEPLMAIGTYYDSISNGAAIPTTDGANTITVDTTVQPSEFTATWAGWHDSSVKEYDGTNWQ